MNDFNINTENILKSFTGNDYVYSKTYDRIYKIIGDINYHDVPGDDGIPTILVDTDGGMNDFKSLKAANVYEVLSTPKGFSYNEYSKNVGKQKPVWVKNGGEVDWTNQKFDSCETIMVHW